MTRKIALTLDDVVVDFLDRHANGNRSAYVNQILLKARASVLEAELAEAYRRDSADPEYLAEMALWDGTVGDGLNDNLHSASESAADTSNA